MTTMTPSVLDEKVPDEKVPVYLQLVLLVGDDTIASIEFGCDPVGLDMTDQSILDSGKTAAALVGGGVAGTDYLVFAKCTMVSGQVYEPVVTLPVIARRGEVSLRRPQIL